jgi:hypothetical protein
LAVAATNRSNVVRRHGQRAVCAVPRSSSRGQRKRAKKSLTTAPPLRGSFLYETAESLECDGMDRFTDSELVGIIVAIEMARQALAPSGRVLPPNIFDVIEAKIRPALHVRDDVLDQLLFEAIGELEWIN